MPYMIIIECSPNYIPADDVLRDILSGCEIAYEDFAKSNGAYKTAKEPSVADQKTIAKRLTDLYHYQLITYFAA